MIDPLNINIVTSSIDIEDLCYVVRDKSDIAFMRKQFNEHWKALA